MLILTRKKGESIMIGDDVVVTFLGYDNGEASIGVAAPKKIPVHREEVFNRIKLGIPKREPNGNF